MSVSSESREGLAADVADVPTPEELVARAEVLVPKLRERAADAERQRRLPDVTMEELVEAGFNKILQPPRFGGYGLTHDVQAEVVQTLAQGCGSSGWVANLLIGHNWQVGLFDLEAQHDVWDATPNAFIATASLVTKSEITPVDGGLRISGRWKFASGSDFADWFMLMKSSATNLDWMLVPRSDVEIVDDWFVSGMCATGSKDIVLDDVFIPSHRIVGVEEVSAGTAPGASLPGGVQEGTVPFLEAVIWGNPSAIIGMTRGIAAAFRDAMVGKRSALTGDLQVERPSNQIKLAQAYAEIDTALTVMRNRLGQVRRWAVEGAPEDPVERMVVHRDAAYVSQMMVRTATTLAVGAGANATYHKSPIQRFARDILAAGSHAAMAWEEIAEPYGRELWGVSPKTGEASA